VIVNDESPAIEIALKDIHISKYPYQEEDLKPVRSSELASAKANMTISRK
jgi:hypothetical protein